MEEASSLLRHGGFPEAGTFGKAPAKQVRWNKGQEQRRTDMGVYCGVVERHVIGGKVYSPITFQQREVASFFNSTLAIALDTLLPTPSSDCGSNTCLLSLLDILSCYNIYFDS